MEQEEKVKEIGTEIDLKINGYNISVGQVERNGKGLYIQLGCWVKFEDNGVDTNEVQLRKLKSGLYKWSQSCQIELFDNLILNRSLRDCDIGANCFNVFCFLSFEVTLFFNENVSLKDKTLIKAIELYSDLIYSYIEDNQYITIKQTRKS